LTGEYAAPPSPAPPTAALRDSIASPAHITVRVVADTLHLALDLPARELAGAGVLADRNTDGQVTPAELEASRDSLAHYLQTHLFLVQDDGLLASAVLGPAVPEPATGVGVERFRVAMRAPLLNTYERIGFASSILTDQIHGYKTLITVEWKDARAEFDVAQSLQWVEPPAPGATKLELPGRYPGPGAGR
jgi:hypothetical protein